MRNAAEPTPRLRGRPFFVSRVVIGRLQSGVGAKPKLDAAVNSPSFPWIPSLHRSPGFFRDFSMSKTEPLRYTLYTVVESSIFLSISSHRVPSTRLSK